MTPKFKPRRNVLQSVGCHLRVSKRCRASSTRPCVKAAYGREGGRGAGRSARESGRGEARGRSEPGTGARGRGQTSKPAAVPLASGTMLNPRLEGRPGEAQAGRTAARQRAAPAHRVRALDLVG